MDNELDRVGLEKNASRGAEAHEPDQGSQAEQMYAHFEGKNDAPGHNTAAGSDSVVWIQCSARFGPAGREARRPGKGRNDRSMVDGKAAGGVRDGADDVGPGGR